MRIQQSKKYGKTLAMVRSIKESIEKKGVVGVPGCKDPTRILEMLRDMGVEAKAEPMMSSKRHRAVYSSDGFEERIVGFTSEGRKRIGFYFF